MSVENGTASSPRMSSSIVTKIKLVSSASLIIGLFVVSVAALFMAKQELAALQTSNSLTLANVVADDVRSAMLSDNRKLIDERITEILNHKQVLFLSIYDSKGEERGTRTQGNDSVSAVIRNGQPESRESSKNGLHILETYIPLVNDERCTTCHEKGTKILGVIRLGASMGQAYDSIRNSAIFLILWGFLAAVVSIVSLTIALRTILMKRLKFFVEKVTEIAQGEGDLTKRLDTAGNDELAEVNKQFNKFLDTLHQLVSKTALASEHVAQSASAIRESSQDAFKSIEEAVSQTSTVATAGEEMSATSGDIAQNCSCAAESSHRSSKLASEGAMVIQATIEGMSQISERVKNAATAIKNLGDRSDQIGAIAGTIEDIADQTNLLALNAAIESARAGEHGRGFAVVADEVRALSERTARATREISEMIRAIQRETRTAVETMEAGVTAVARGSEDAAKSGNALQGILQQISDVAAQINQIATAAEEQTSTTNEISSSIHRINDIFNRTSQTAQETSCESEKLNILAKELLEGVKRFKTD